MQRRFAVEDEAFALLLHYNFPPFSVGEVKFPRAGAKSDMVLSPNGAVNPFHRSGFPYAMQPSRTLWNQRIFLDGNGLRGSLALMDAGVLLKPCAGIAMGLVWRAISTPSPDMPERKITTATWTQSSWNAQESRRSDGIKVSCERCNDA
jgi:hypothetical protein